MKDLQTNQLTVSLSNYEIRVLNKSLLREKHNEYEKRFSRQYSHYGKHKTFFIRDLCYLITYLSLKTVFCYLS